MREVTIYDMGDPSRRRTIYADSGNMQMSRGMSDLELTLFNGHMQDIPTTTPTQLQRLYFNVDFVRMRGVGNQFEKSKSDSYKGNREMTICEMSYAVKRAKADYLRAQSDFVRAKRQAAEDHLPLSRQAKKLKPKVPNSTDVSSLYCSLINTFTVKTAHAQTVRASSTAPLADRPISKPVHKGASAAAATEGPPSVLVDQAVGRLTESAEAMNELSVEINKKFALAVACFVFVLLGAPIALRFPRGGVGLTIGVSLVVFALYYVCLIGGQALGNRGIIPPAISMWMADVLFAAVALWLLARMGSEGSTARGGDARELLDSVRDWFRKKSAAGGA
jgi:lipopolysaccharide export system permease protein